MYRNHHLDSTRWEVLQPRDDDIIITTSYKSGTTWTQHIVNELVHGEQDELPMVNEISAWPDNCVMGISREDLAAYIESISTRRFMKSHLPLDGLPFHPQIKYIIVARDSRDVFMSLFNHYSNYTDLAFTMINGEDLVGEPCPRCPDDPRELWHQWITRGWFEWESEGYPFWSNMRHTQSYWDYKHLPNFLFLHYGDMLKDLPGSIRRIARFLDIAVADVVVERITSATTFSTIKKRIDQIAEDEDPARMMFKGERARSTTRVRTAAGATC